MPPVIEIFALKIVMKGHETQWISSAGIGSPPQLNREPGKHADNFAFTFGISLKWFGRRAAHLWKRFEVFVLAKLQVPAHKPHNLWKFTQKGTESLLFADEIQFREKIKFQYEFIRKNLRLCCCVSRINFLRTHADFFSSTLLQTQAQIID